MLKSILLSAGVIGTNAISVLYQPPVKPAPQKPQKEETFLDATDETTYSFLEDAVKTVGMVCFI